MKRKIFRVIIVLLALMGIVLIVIRFLPITYKGLALPRPPQVAVLVELVLGSPVDQTHMTQVGIQYFIAFILRDGTTVSRGYSPDSGELYRGITLPEAFGTAVEQALLVATPTPP